MNSRFFKTLFFIIVVLLALEIPLQIHYRLVYNKWYFTIPTDYYPKLFRLHPYLVVAGRPGALYVSRDGNKQCRHNSWGFRGPEIRKIKDPGVKRVLVFGGSSGYCAGVSDNQTWPYYLQQRLGKGYEVVNLSVPGYGTVEHIIQTALLISDLSPDICVYYEGWNDIRNMHIKDLKADYSDFHGLSQYDNLQVFRVKFLSPSLLVSGLVGLIEKIFLGLDYRPHITPTPDAYTPHIDDRALELYKRNIGTIAALCKRQNARPLMIPQVLNYNKLTSDKPYGWLPYVRDKDIKSDMAFYNDELEKVCHNEKIDFLKDVLGVAYLDSDFIDNGHFSPEGNRKFADLVGGYIKDHF